MKRLAAAVALILLAAPVAMASRDASGPWARLHRALHLPHVAADAACPISRVDRRVDWKAARIFGGAGIGPGPAYPALGTSGRLRTSRDEQFGGPWFGQKVFWYVLPSYQGRVLIRGRRLDGQHPLGFNGDAVPERELRIESGETVWWDGQPDRSRGIASSIRVRAAGCYGVQIDGVDFSRVVVFRVLAP
jgi:hypothetical protein